MRRAFCARPGTHLCVPLLSSTTLVRRVLFDRICAAGPPGIVGFRPAGASRGQGTPHMQAASRPMRAPAPPPAQPSPAVCCVAPPRGSAPPRAGCAAPALQQGGWASGWDPVSWLGVYLLWVGGGGGGPPPPPPRGGPAPTCLQEGCRHAGAGIRLSGQVRRAVLQLEGVVVPAEVGLVAAGGNAGRRVAIRGSRRHRRARAAPRPRRDGAAAPSTRAPRSQLLLQRGGGGSAQQAGRDASDKRPPGAPGALPPAAHSQQLIVGGP